jgi:hypothetical protein
VSAPKGRRKGARGNALGKMSFRAFIYYCALGGAWAAFLVAVVVLVTGLRALNVFVATPLITVLLGTTLAAVVGGLDALLNAPQGRAWPLLARLGFCAGVGFVGGLVSGLIADGVILIGDWLHMPGTAVVGWVLVGTVIGASIGAYDLARSLKARQGHRQALRKTFNGLVGGFLGGLVGGLLSEGITLAVRAGESRLYLGRTALALGLVVLGGSIGLLIGLAQVILKEAWLRVDAGFRPGRELLLSKEEFAIGRAEGCDLGLFGDSGVEKVHARILTEQGRYLLADADTAGGTFLNDARIDGPTLLHDGDVIRLGNSVLRFGVRNRRSNGTAKDVG